MILSIYGRSGYLRRTQLNKNININININRNIKLNKST